MSLPTGSGVERAFACPASCALTRAGHTGAAALAGTENHSKIEHGDTSRPVVREILDGAEEVRHEVAYALDVAKRTVREIGVNIARGYGELAPSEVALTIDLECRKGDTWWVVDWKSRGRVTPAPANWQLRCGVLAVMGRHGAQSAIGAIGYLDDSELDASPFDIFHAPAMWADLASMALAVREAQALVAKGEPVAVSSGPWCKYCPSLPHCPAHTRLALSLLGELEAVDNQIAALTVEQCGRAWELLERYESIADRVKDSIRERARREFIPLTNGRRLALVESSRRSLDTKKAAEMLGDAAPYKTTVFTQIRKVKAEEAAE